MNNEPEKLAAIVGHAGKSSVVSRRGRAAYGSVAANHRDGLANGVSLGLVIGCRSPYFGGVQDVFLVDSQVSPYGPRISKLESASKWRPRRPKNGAIGNATTEFIDQQAVPRASLGRVGRERRRRGSRRAGSRPCEHEATLAAPADCRRCDLLRPLRRRRGVLGCGGR